MRYTILKNIIWKTVGYVRSVDFTGMYFVNNIGDVKKIVCTYNAKTGNVDRKETILKQAINKHGYAVVVLSKGGKAYSCLVHRLVANAFIPNDDPQNKTQINHKDENKLNNCVENLEWCTPEYNIKYGTRTQRQKDTISQENKKDPTNYYPILQLTKDKKVVKLWKTINDIDKNEYNIYSIKRCCEKSGAIHKNYRWYFASRNKLGTHREKIILQLDKNNCLINFWSSIKEAEENGFTKTLIIECCNGKRMQYKKYKWEYAEKYL